LARLAVREDADLYHFHDPDVIFTGLLLKLLGRKVVYDVHEDYPKQILSKDWIRPSILRKVISKVFNFVEKFSAGIYDSVVVATPDISSNFPSRKTTIVRNYPVLSLMEHQDSTAEKEANSPPIVIYAGGLSRVRGTRELITSMGVLAGAVRLYLLGPWLSESFRKECQETPGYEYTEYIGSLPLQEVYQYMRMADVGMAVLYPIKNYLTSLPIKAYEYMYTGLPMIMSDFPLWKEVFGQCAVFVDPHDPEDIADKIRYLLNNPKQADKMVEIGRGLTKNEYNWEKESNSLEELYGDILRADKCNE
jgi:glycosyltransferase involved in cell wall biosynthesis